MLSKLSSPSFIRISLSTLKLQRPTCRLKNNRQSSPLLFQSVPQSSIVDRRRTPPPRLLVKLKSEASIAEHLAGTRTLHIALLDTHNAPPILDQMADEALSKPSPVTNLNQPRLPSSSRQILHRSPTATEDPVAPSFSETHFNLKQPAVGTSCHHSPLAGRPIGAN